MSDHAEVVRFVSFDGVTCEVSVRSAESSKFLIADDLQARVSRTLPGTECAIVVTEQRITRFSPILRDERIVSIHGNEVVVEGGTSVSVGTFVKLQAMNASPSFVPSKSILSSLPGSGRRASFTRQLDADGRPNGLGNLVSIELE